MSRTVEKAYLILRLDIICIWDNIITYLLFQWNIRNDGSKQRVHRFRLAIMLKKICIHENDLNKSKYYQIEITQ